MELIFGVIAAIVQGLLWAMTHLVFGLLHPTLNRRMQRLKWFAIGSFLISCAAFVVGMLLRWAGEWGDAAAAVLLFAVGPTAFMAGGFLGYLVDLEHQTVLGRRRAERTSIQP